MLQRNWNNAEWKDTPETLWVVAEGPGGINQPTNKSGFHVIDRLCQRVLNVHEVHQEITDSFVVSSDLRLRFI